VQRLGEEGLIRVFGVAGYKNSGKTTLIVALVRELTRRGWRVGTIKHAHHAFEIDHPGKDSYLHRAAGAAEVIVASASRWAHIRELGDEPPASLDELLAHMGPLDLVLVEGWKHGSHPRLEVRRKESPAPRLTESDPAVLAVISDVPLPDERCRVLSRDDLPTIADFILQAVGLPVGAASAAILIDPENRA
jgi:molybdopterin-guanine dinucleotide biosynthesis protein B